MTTHTSANFCHSIYFKHTRMITLEGKIQLLLMCITAEPILKMPKWHNGLFPFVIIDMQAGPPG